MKTQDEEAREAFDALERILREPLPTFAEALRRMDRQVLRPDTMFLSRE